MSRIAVLTNISRSLRLFTVLLFATVAAFAQVTIREKVQITPKQNAQPLLSTQGAGVFQVQCTFSGPIDQGNPNLFYSKNIPCGVNQGARVSGTLSATAFTGVYTVGCRLSISCYLESERG